MYWEAILILVAIATIYRTDAMPNGFTEEEVDASQDLLREARQTTNVGILNQTVQILARQLMLQQLFLQERIRSDGDSGIKQTRVVGQGTRPYYADSFTGSRMCAIHEHSNNIRVVGMGEFIAVMNGVEFRTRHNDYTLSMPHKTQQTFHAIQDIPYPNVPKAVTDKATVQEQVLEMREWFKAWRDQDTSVRDYRPYFKPVLCYLEGAWTTAANIQEAFPSDRHSYDAYSWFDLAEKIRFTSFAGKKDSFENYAWLPSTIMEMYNGQLYTAQWNYRILCHPLTKDLKTNRLRVVDDLAARMAFDRTLAAHNRSRAARFNLAPVDSDVWTDQKKNYGLLDELMAEIPGANNYPGNLQDVSLGTTAMKWQDASKPENAAYYHRWFKTGIPDAMGASAQHRGFADQNLFMALTNTPGIAPLFIEKCEKPFYDVCKLYGQRWTYAIPMEIIYLTPLYKWNPYNIEYKGAFDSATGKTVTANGRTGTQANPYAGTNSKKFYQTPASFYTDDGGSGDTADTSEGEVYVLNKAGQVTKVVAAGTRITLPDIPGVGRLRVRYPIMPTHQEGSAVWKELDALKDIVLRPKTQKDKFYEEFGSSSGGSGSSGSGGTTDGSLVLKTKASVPNYGAHIHYIKLSPAEAESLKTQGQTVTAVTTQSRSHNHKMVITRNSEGSYVYTTCDGRSRCFDEHAPHLLPF